MPGHVESRGHGVWVTIWGSREYKHTGADAEEKAKAQLRLLYMQEDEEAHKAAITSWSPAHVVPHLRDLTVRGSAVSLVQAHDQPGHVHMRVDAPEITGHADMLLRVVNRWLTPTGKSLRHMAGRVGDALAVQLPVYDLVLRRRERPAGTVTTWSALAPRAPSIETSGAGDMPGVFKGERVFEARNLVLKQQGDQHYVRAVILEPNTVDLTTRNPDGSPTGAAGDYYNEDDIQVAMHYWMENSGMITLLHTDHGGRPLTTQDIVLLENFQMPASGELDGKQVKKGAWIQAHRIKSPDLWQAFKSGKIRSWSIGAAAKWRYEEVDLSAVDQAQHLG